ncbi:unnamed protein product, partial [Musa acuminata var. zebrina]
PIAESECTPESLVSSSPTPSSTPTYYSLSASDADAPAAEAVAAETVGSCRKPPTAPPPPSSRGSARAAAGASSALSSTKSVANRFPSQLTLRRPSRSRNAKVFKLLKKLLVFGHQWCEVSFCFTCGDEN